METYKQNFFHPLNRATQEQLLQQERKYKYHNASLDADISECPQVQSSACSISNGTPKNDNSVARQRAKADPLSPMPGQLWKNCSRWDFQRENEANISNTPDRSKWTIEVGSLSRKKDDPMYLSRCNRVKQVMNISTSSRAIQAQQLYLNQLSLKQLQQVRNLAARRAAKESQEECV